jgi:hypothetical protein
VPAGSGFPGDQMKDINVYCLRFFVAGAQGGCKECTLAGRVWGLLAVGGVLADRAVRVREKAMRTEVRPATGLRPGPSGETLNPRCRRIATALEIGERQYPEGA